MLFQFSVFLSIFFMGLMGGPHCIAMCGAPCTAISAQGFRQVWQFHLGRILGYGVLGGLAAYSVNSLAWFSNQSMSLHPIWTFFHGFIFGIAVAMLTVWTAFTFCNRLSTTCLRAHFYFCFTEYFSY